MPHSVHWKLQKSCISKDKIFLLSDPVFDLNQMPFLFPNKGSFPLRITPWPIKKILLEEMLLGLAGLKRKLNKDRVSERWHFKAGQDCLGNLFCPAAEASTIWNLASLVAAGGTYLFLNDILCFKFQKWASLCRSPMRHCLFSQAVPRNQVCCFVFFFSTWLFIFHWQHFSPSTPSNLQLVSCEYI